MRAALFLWIACLWSAHAASASTVELSPERQAWLEGVWSGLPTDVSANKLCSRLSPPPGAITLAIEFQKTGGVIFYSDGSQTALRGMISSASEKNGVFNLTVNDEVFRFRPDGERIMFRVRSSASIGGDVDVMVFRRCEQPADRSAIDIDADAMKFLASDLPGDEALHRRAHRAEIRRSLRGPGNAVPLLRPCRTVAVPSQPLEQFRGGRQACLEKAREDPPRPGLRLADRVRSLRGRKIRGPAQGFRQQQGTARDHSYRTANGQHLHPAMETHLRALHGVPVPLLRAAPARLSGP